MYDSPLAPHLEILLARDHRHGLATSLFRSSNGNAVVLATHTAAFY
jgi:hypothetical protein